MRELAVLIMVMICVVFTCGCTAQTSPQATATQATQAVMTQAVVTQPETPASNGIVKNVYIRDMAFLPDIITISPGTTVVWTNEDSVSHRVVHLPTEANGRELFHSDPLAKGDSFRYTFQTAGRYYYADPQHAGGRKSTVIVE